MLPLLRLMATRPQDEFSSRQVHEHLAEEFELSEEDRKQLLPSGSQQKFENRVGWAATYLKKAGLLESKRRGYYKISERGLQVLSKNPSTIDNSFLSQFPEFVMFKTRRTETNSTPESIIDVQTPEESLELGYQKIRDELASQLLERIKQCSPAFFERLVIELLVKMGYGGSRIDAGKAIGKSGDGGIDGIIKEDKLGLDVIYIQAKRWDGNSIGGPSVQQFAGALQGQRANKGIFITTSTFTDAARKYVAQIGSKIVLIDGEQLAQLMIDHNVGVSVAANYEIKRIDSDYFSEEL